MIYEGTVNGFPALIDRGNKTYAILPNNYRRLEVDGVGIVGAIDNSTGRQVKLNWTQFDGQEKFTVVQPYGSQCPR